MSYSVDPASQELKIMEENHYYPFGLKHTNYNSDWLIYGRQNESTVLKKPGPIVKYEPVYKYKYNGKEYQDELGLNTYDYGARNYDPALGRWMNIDPLAEKYLENSTYVYAVNNPIYFIDPNGMEIKEYDWGIIYNGEDAQDLLKNIQNLLNNSSSKSEEVSEEEPPVNFFEPTSKNKKQKPFNDVFNEMNKKENYKIGDNLFNVYGHGYFGFMSNRKEDKAVMVRDADDFDATMSKRSSAYKKAIESGIDFTLYLYTCQSAGVSYQDPVSIAAQISKKHPNATIIGYEGYVMYGVKNGTPAIVGVSSVREDKARGIKSNNEGYQVTYKNGKEISRQSASEIYK